MVLHWGWVWWFCCLYTVNILYELLLVYVLAQICCFCYLTQISTGPLSLCVGGPAYVHTCVLSGSRGTAGVLAFSQNTIFKPFYISLSNLRSTVSLCRAPVHFLHVFLLLLLSFVHCSSHMNNIWEGNSRNWQDYLLTSASWLLHPHLCRWKKKCLSACIWTGRIFLSADHQL